MFCRRAPIRTVSSSCADVTAPRGSVGLSYNLGGGGSDPAFLETTDPQFIGEDLDSRQERDPYEKSGRPEQRPHRHDPDCDHGGMNTHGPKHDEGDDHVSLDLLDDHLDGQHEKRRLR